MLKKNFIIYRKRIYPEKDTIFEIDGRKFFKERVMPGSNLAYSTTRRKKIRKSPIFKRNRLVLKKQTNKQTHLPIRLHT